VREVCDEWVGLEELTSAERCILIVGSANNFVLDSGSLSSYETVHLQGHCPFLQCILW
jgi:hypothetical protein